MPSPYLLVDLVGSEWRWVGFGQVVVWRPVCSQVVVVV